MLTRAAQQRVPSDDREEVRHASLRHASLQSGVRQPTHSNESVARHVTIMFVPGRVQAELRKDIEYGRAGEVSLRMNAYLPSGIGPHPAAIVVHGGGWVSGDRALSVAPLFQPLEEAGFAWFSIRYRFATDLMLFGAAVDDVQQAIEHVRQHAREYNIDPSGLALIGESAGAHLSALATLRNPEGVRQAIMASGFGDL